MGKIESTVKIEFEVEMVVQALIVTGVEHSKELFTEMKKNENFIYIYILKSVSLFFRADIVYTPL